MIVQFLNGSQFESNLPVEKITEEIYRRREDFGLEIVLPSQLELLINEDDPVLYALVRLLEDVPFVDVINSIAESQEHHMRCQMLTLYYQYMACRSKFSFERDDGSYYIIDKTLGVEVFQMHIRETGLESFQFRRPELMMEYKELNISEDRVPRGWKAWYHWVNLHGELHPLCTLVLHEDCVRY